MPVTISKSAFNLRDLLNAAKKKTGLFGEQVIRAETSDDYFKVVGTNKNLLINGCFRFAQRGASISNPTANQYLLDRWFFGSDQASCTVSQGTENLPDGTYAKTLRVDWGASGSNWLDLYQGIEEYQRVNTKTITMSAWVRTNVPRFRFRQYGMSSYGQEFPSNGQWHKVVATFNTTASTLTRGSGTSSAFFGMASDADHVSGSFVEFANVQLELGSNATPFEYRHLQQELALCQRYYYYAGFSGISSRSHGYDNLNYRHRCPINFPVPMRVNPTLSKSYEYVYNDDGSAISGASVGFQVGSPLFFYAMASTTTQPAAGTFYNLTFDIIASAEL